MAQASEAARAAIGAEEALRRERYRELRFVTLVGSVVDLALGVVKLAVGWVAQSASLMADGVHSLSDLVTDFMVLWAGKHAHRGADEDHPYGHARIETATTVALGAALVLVAIGITADSVRRLFDPALLLHPDALALWVAAASVIAKEAMYHYTMRSARRLRSGMLRANAWHSRTDAISSVVVIIGVGGAMLGLHYIDAVAAVVVAVMIAKVGWDLSWASVRELVDTAPEAALVDDIRKIILQVDGVEAVHLLRTRLMGGRALVDVHIILSDPRLSVSEGHQISETVRARLIRRIEDVDDVTVHIDHEDDEVASPSRHLPLRHRVMARLDERWAALPAAARIQRVNLHYIDGGIETEVVLPLEMAPNRAAADDLARCLREALGEDPDIRSVRLLFS